MQTGGVRERPNRHDWKSCVGKLTVGSNPTASAHDRTDDWSSTTTTPWAWPWPRRPKPPEHGDVPVGAVAVRGGVVIAARHNEREQRADPTAHAELLALADAARATGGWRLSGVTLFVTLEPCPMCAGGARRGEGQSAGLRRCRSQSRSVRIALQPVRRSSSQPRGRRRVRGAGRRVGHPANSEFFAGRRDG